VIAFTGNRCSKCIVAFSLDGNVAELVGVERRSATVQTVASHNFAPL
jgi:hypothetical protein